MVREIQKTETLDKFYGLFIFKFYIMAFLFSLLSLSLSSGDGQFETTVTVELNGRNSYD
jgi:hypothetical protein